MPHRTAATACPLPTRRALIAVSTLLVACRRPRDARRTLRIAAASSLTLAFDALRTAEEPVIDRTIRVAYGATGLLARQIRQGAPFDLFAAADLTPLRELERDGILSPDGAYAFGSGRLVIYSRADAPARIERLEDLAGPAVRRVAIANPDVAPYGRAAREALVARGLWPTVEPRVVYAESVRGALQFAESGNADAALTAASVADPARGGRVVGVDPALYTPIVQAIAIVRATPDPAGARAVVRFVRSPAGRAVLARHGFAPPAP